MPARRRRGILGRMATLRRRLFSLRPGEPEPPGAPLRLACPDCDLLVRGAPPGRGQQLECPRCGAELLQRSSPSLQVPLAFAVTAALLLVLANAFPILQLDAHGRHADTTLWGTVRMMHADGMTSVAALVFVTVIAAPLLEVAAVLYLLLPLAAGRVPAGVAPVSRLVAAIRPWGMVEVFMLGALVAAVKLAQLAQLHTGLALWSCAGLMACVATVAATFDDQRLWRRVELLRARQRGAMA